MHQEYPSYANLANLKLIEELYMKWQEDPASVEPSWKNFFDGMQLASTLAEALPARQESGDLRVFNLITAYRTYGHLLANCNVIATEAPPFPEELKLENFALTEADRSRRFPSLGLLSTEEGTLDEILDVLQKTYCQTVGIEYMDLGSVEIEKWVQKEIEPLFPTHLQNTEKIEILKQLNQAEGFEDFLHMKYVGQKRFSLEGAETLIPVMHAIMETAGAEGVTEGVIGMAHRGRLNVLATIMGKSYSYIFEEFEDAFVPEVSESSGDVKYHLGLAGTYTTSQGNKVSLTLAANPSHLESVDPVVLGNARAIQEMRGKANAKTVLPIAIHGDAAVSGQGIVYETMTMNRLRGYGVNGTIHIVVNNQIGYTTLPTDCRSTRYCTDIAKAFGAPVFHVNAEDPEMCVAAARLATRLRQRFGCDVFIDLQGYRKYGHNESDEPAFTQPLEYQLIRAKKTIREIYRDRLVSQGTLSETEAKTLEDEFRSSLQTMLDTVKSQEPSPDQIEPRTPGKDLPELFALVETRVEKEKLLSASNALSVVPEGWNIHPKVQRLIKERGAMLIRGETEAAIDWGMGEMMAYATLAVDKVHVRLSGQDVRRGTFAHRHAMYVDQVTSAHYFPLSHVGGGQANCDVFNSPLSEYGSLGFEFGYSLFYPHSLTVWEAQFGDFANGAQITIDQYISTAEMKWGDTTNLTLLLPHGYEAMGPEHSSARIERFLLLCGNENMLVANCSTPAQLFHFLRRQALREMKKPAVVFTPKALLRHPLCRSLLSDFTTGAFSEILNDPTPPENPERILFCSGKIYYELIQEREKRRANDVILRIEQLYPLHEEKLSALIKQYPTASTCLYVQEEHENMGAWRYLEPTLKRLIGDQMPVKYVGRFESASPAAGSRALHKREQEILFANLYGEG